MPTNLTWYDVLGVPRDATPEEIKAAWRTATDKFEPGSGSGQFRMFNEAADVLLDPVRRRAYDAELAGEGAGTQRGSTATTATAATTATMATMAPTPVPVSLDEPAPDETEAPTRTRTRPRLRRSGGGRSRRPSRLQVVLAAVLAVLSVAALVAAVRFGLDVRDEARVADARDQAPAAAERAAKAMLSYNYKQLPADRERASAYLTAGFKKKYLENFKLLEKQKDGTPGTAVQTKTVVTASVLGSGVVDATAGVARVLVYVNQVSQKPGADPQIFQNRVSMKMEQQGNRWLVDDLKSY